MMKLIPVLIVVLVAGAHSAQAQDRLVCSRAETSAIHTYYERVLPQMVRAFQLVDANRFQEAMQLANALAADAERMTNELSPGCLQYVRWIDQQIEARFPRQGLRDFREQSVYRRGNDFVMPGMGSCIGTNCIFN